MEKLQIPPKQDAVSELSASEVNQIVSKINEQIDEVVTVKTKVSKNKIDAGGV